MEPLISTLIVWTQTGTSLFETGIAATRVAGPGVQLAGGEAAGAHEA